MSPSLEYPWNVVTIVCFCVFGGLIILGIFFRVKLHLVYKGAFKRTPKRSYDGLPKSLQRAMVELEGVTENRIRTSAQSQCDLNDCPICLAPLHPNLTEVENTAEQVDLEAGVLKATTAGKTTTTSNTAIGKGIQANPSSINEAVLKMKRCQHLFHARCLATWFLRRRYDCPVCRAPYYQVVERMSSREALPLYEAHHTLQMIPIF